MGAPSLTAVRNDLQSSAGLSSQAIDAHYFNIVDAEAWPVAGLLVLLDGQGQPVRAELHLYEELPSHTQEAAVRQSRDVLQGQYESEAFLSLRVLQTSQMRDAVDVRLGGGTAPPSRPKSRLPVPLFAILGTVAVIAVVVIVALALRGSQGSPSTEPVESSDQAPDAIVIQSVGGAELTANGRQAAAAEPQVELPRSINARPDLRIGMRVVIVPGLRLTLRSEPGAEAGVPLGYMMDDDTAVIVSGPQLSEGTSDTIVWWLVSLDDGTEAWAAANTSDQTLLIPAQ